MVYLYGACDRARSWPALATTRQVADRFAGGVSRLPFDDLRPFVDLSAINEFDVIEQDHTLLERHGDYFRRVFEAWSSVMSPSLLAQVHSVVGR